MQHVRNFFKKGNVATGVLLATAFIGFMAIVSTFTFPAEEKPFVDMRIEPREKTIEVGDRFSISIIVEAASEPVNVFAGELLFNSNVLSVDSIDYNISAADLWAEKPWFSNGDGTINFAGGTTQPGGFNGSDTLLTITFDARDTGAGTLTIQNARILKYDGLGTDAKLKQSLEAVFTITDTPENNMLTRDDLVSSYTIIAAPPSTDLNGDGRQSLTDISIFMLNIAGNNPRFDFNLDGKVNTKDLSILMNAD